jgi:hypothetical protein
LIGRLKRAETTQKGNRLVLSGSLQASLNRFPTEKINEYCKTTINLYLRKQKFQFLKDKALGAVYKSFVLHELTLKTKN